jgi:hypothetical protein
MKQVLWLPQKKLTTMKHPLLVIFLLRYKHQLDLGLSYSCASDRRHPQLRQCLLSFHAPIHSLKMLFRGDCYPPIDSVLFGDMKRLPYSSPPPAALNSQKMQITRVTISLCDVDVVKMVSTKKEP